MSKTILSSLWFLRQVHWGISFYACQSANGLHNNYTVLETKMIFEEARAECIRLGMVMATWDSAEEWNQMVELAGE